MLASCAKDEINDTYEFPDVSTGFIVSEKRVSVLMGIELWDKHRIAGDLVLAEDLAALSVSWRLTSLYEIKAGLFYGWDFEAQKESWGGTFLVTEF